MICPYGPECRNFLSFLQAANDCELWLCLEIACLALAGRLGVPALTADRSWQEIAEAAGIEIELIRYGLH
jgi:PIN domain nuclease of toxin-antitoxin system